MNMPIRITFGFIASTILTTGCLRASVSFPFVTVGNIGNANDSVPVDGLYYGGVASNYQISATNVTVAQYTEFLNSVDPSGSNGLQLYSPGMGDHPTSGGILFESSAANGAKYGISVGFDNKPVTHVSFLDAMRFANWLSNGQGNGSTETGAYSLALGGMAPRNPGALFFIPSENEWYKAAYYDPTSGHYYRYGTQSDTLPAASGPTATPNSANYGNVVEGVTDVGAYTGSASPYGLFDMSGNVWNWNDTAVDGVARGLRGGSWAEIGTPNVGSANRFSNEPSTEAPNYGFRIATVGVPEPTSTALLFLGSTLCLRRRRGGWIQ